MRCQADRQTVLLDLDFELKDYKLLGLSSPALGEAEVGTKKRDSPVRVENRGVGTAEEIVSLRFWLDVSFHSLNGSEFICKICN